MLTALFAALQAVAPASVTEAPRDGVTVYPSAFFAEQRPEMAFDMLQRLPGFTFDGGDSSVRGLAGAGGNVLIDGQRPASKGDRIEDVLRRLPAGQVDHIELIRGGAPGIDMQGKTVVANIIRKAGGGARGLVAVANRFVYDGRNLPGFRLEGSGEIGPRSWEASFLAGTGLDDGAGVGPKVARDTSGAIILQGLTLSEADATNYSLTGAGETPLAGGRLRANGRLFSNKYTFDEVNRLTVPVRRDEEGFDELTHEGEVGLRYTRALGSTASIESFAIQRLSERNVVSTFKTPGLDAVFDLNNKNGESILRAVYKRTWSPTLSMEAGGEGAFNWLDGETTYAENGVNVSLPAANVRVEERRGEAFTTLTWRATPDLSLEGGLRAETSTISSDGDVDLEKTLNFIKPRALLTWSPVEGRQVRLRIEREVGQLNFGDFVASSNFGVGAVQAGNPDLNPQQSWVAEAAFEQRFWSSGSVVLTLRHAELTDVVDRIPIVGPSGVFDAPGNIGGGTSDQIGINLTLPLDRLGLTHGLLRGESTWNHSKVTDPTTGEKRRISGERPVDWQFHLTQDLPEWKMNWGVDAFGSFRERYYRLTEIETRKLNTYLTPFAEYKPRRDITVRVELQNALGRPLLRRRDVYDGPRSTAPFLFNEATDYDVGRIVYVRIRKTLGG